MSQKLTRDTKLKSASEALANSFGGYPIGYFAGLVILPVTLNWIQDDLLLANLVVTALYATISFLRTYYLRRLFLRFGYQDNFVMLIKNALQKSRRIIQHDTGI